MFEYAGLSLLCLTVSLFFGEGNSHLGVISEGYAEVRSNGFEYYDVESVQPIEVNEDGHSLRAESHIQNRPKRSIRSRKQKYFSFDGFGERFQLQVEPSKSLLSPGFKVYHLGANSSLPYEEKIEKNELMNCLYTGNMRNQPDSAVALNLCGGMSGLLRTETGDDYLIEPAQSSVGTQKTHVLKRRSVNAPGKESKRTRQQTHFCGRKRRYMPHKPRRKDHWLPDEFTTVETNKTLRSKRSIDRDPTRQRLSAGRRRHRQSRRSIETLVVADKAMVKKHGTENVTAYLLTVFNMVSMLYQDSTIGNNVSVILVGLVLLEGDEPGLSLSHSAETSLSSFCQWQSTVHTASGKQHDHAVLVTGLDICSWKDEPCDTLGFAPISGMCSKYRSCTVNEDSGLALAFTVAHEIGHNFGMVHDGQGSSPCKKKRGTLMAASLSGLDSRLLWSECSRRDLAHFLESPRSYCLRDEPDSPDELQFPNYLPGQLYDADMQCRLQFGTKSRLCEHYPRKSEVCRALWCQRNGRECETKFLPAAEGTACGKDKWCRKGACVNRDGDAEKVRDGGWGEFSTWSNCSRTCGGGIETRKRACDSPLPMNGGSYCKGEDSEYRICATSECRAGGAEDLADPCSTFNKRTVKGKFYRWRPYGKDLGALSRCRIYCVPAKEDLYLILSTKLQDGTSCAGNYSSVCVDGECRAVGCDGKIESTANPDLCGVCNGDNSTCKVIEGNIRTNNLSIGYHEVVRIPANSRHINVSESRESPTYLSLQDGMGRYYLNGHWVVDWPGRYSANGTLFSYRRWPGQSESLIAKGPTTGEVVVEVLMQTTVDSEINYRFVVPLDKFQWKMQNSTCSVTCGSGNFLSSPVCMMYSGEIASDTYCNTVAKPSEKEYSCREKFCKFHWRIGDWSACDPDCKDKYQRRNVSCTDGTQTVHWSLCDERAKPISIKECIASTCFNDWFKGPWSKCKGRCRSGHQTRSVTCRKTASGPSLNFSLCNASSRPQHARKCKPDCPADLNGSSLVWTTGPWSECGLKCEREVRNVTCVRKLGDSEQPSKMCKPETKPRTERSCTSGKCNAVKHSDCQNKYGWCPISTNKNLCTLKFYSTNCCKTCRKWL